MDKIADNFFLNPFSFLEIDEIADDEVEEGNFGLSKRRFSEVGGTSTDATSFHGILLIFLLRSSSFSVFPFCINSKHIFGLNRRILLTEYSSKIEPPLSISSILFDVELSVNEF
ncbi:hypothetical protein Mgra_00002800 [Meloidogyne graminicola]|uniref:Uncharacterized protein n=1 Tax=Meloidogyne graminicola TaxID=189291 RepID=A0A8S9ZW39_9BILA|nr:hypothetical protein Mgra_00002800 [Meloidogyne graminicola]